MVRLGLERHLLRRWQAAGPPPFYLRLLSRLYRLLSKRRWPRPAERPPCPVIVVGNITAGGSGKTPVVAAVARLLCQQGQTPAIISRGYGGRVSSEPRAVTSVSDPAEVGDEPVLLARRAGCAVWVCADRRAALHAGLRGGADVIVADDGLQHPNLPRSFEICVIDGQRGFGNGHLLPAGPLRQPLERLDSVDATLIKRAGRTDCTDDLPGMHFPVEPGAPYRLGTGEGTEGTEIDRQASFDAVCAIGNPDSFFALLEALGYRFRRHPFPDHHVFSGREFAGLAGPLLVTEKDAVKLERLTGLPECWVLPIEAQLPETLIGQLLGHVREFRPS